MSEELRYPIGKFAHQGDITAAQRAAWIREIEALPDALAAALAGLTDEQLDTPYREGGWTVRQVAHHVADSHMNSIIRFKLALTEEHPTIKPYEEGDWAMLGDSLHAPVGPAVELLRGLHAKWALLLRAMDDAAYARTFYHPGNQKTNRLDWTLGLYVWHGKHHVAHITSLRARMGW